MKPEAPKKTGEHRAEPDNIGTPWNHFFTSMIGREKEIKSLQDRFLDPSVRILNITGAVGVGKSRTAAVAFPGISEIFTGGSRSIELDGRWTEPELRAELEGALPSAAGLPRGRFLLALEGCADLMAVLPSVLTRLLAARSELAILLTAPEPLGVYGEDVLRLAPLPVPAKGDGRDIEKLQEIASVRLFLRRAQAVRPGFALTAENRESVARLCARTDGIPLAIELAAARMKIDSPRDVLDGLDGDLDILSASGGETLSRHAGMRSAIAWSLTRMRYEDQEMLSRIAVFREGVDFSAAEAVTGASANETRRRLERLVDGSLLQAREREDGELAFLLPGLTKQYVLEWLRQSGSLTQVLRAHAEYFLSMTDSLRGRETDPVPGSRPVRFRRWLSDVESAMFFLLDSGDCAGAVRMAAAFGLYWRGYGGLRKAADLLGEVLGTEELPPPVALEGEAAFGELLMWLGEHDEAERRLHRALQGHAGLGDDEGAAADTRRLGALAFHRGDVTEAQPLLHEARGALTAPGSERERSVALRELADCRLVQGDHRSAAEEAAEALRESERLRDGRNAGLAGCVLADALFASGRKEAAEEQYRTALRRLQELGDRAACAVALERLAVLWIRCRGEEERSHRAVRGVSAASAMRLATGCAAPVPLGTAVEEALAQARTRLGEQAYEEAWAAGKGLELDAAVAEALAPVEAASAQRRTQPAHPLTEREFQVAELVAQGMINREIARRLGIAEWTAINHLRKVMRKLDCPSRVHVAGWFARRNREEEKAASLSS